MNFHALMRDRDMPAREVADLLLQLPAGSRVAKAVGGMWAWTDEVKAQLIQTYVVRSIWHAYTGGKGKAPEPPEAPKGWLVEQAEQEKAALTWQQKAEAWKRDNADKFEEYKRRMELSN